MAVIIVCCHVTGRSFIRCLIEEIEPRGGVLRKRGDGRRWEGLGDRVGRSWR